MNRFAALLDALAYEPRRNGKLALLKDYFAQTPDPDRGYALAALTGGLDFRHAKPALLRELVAARVDEVLFRLSYDYVGDLAETIALIWPAEHGANRPPTLTEVVDRLETAGKTDLPGLIARWLDALDEGGRWALIKIMTGALRVGVSARLAKTALAQYGDLDIDEVEEVWHGLEPPYEALFAWAEGRAGKPDARLVTPFRPVMLAHPIEDGDLRKLDPADYAAEWKWDGIRVQLAAEPGDGGNHQVRLYSRTGDDISRAFPDLVEAIDFHGTIDGELLVMRDGNVAPFSDLQKRLNRKTVSKTLLKSHPVMVRAYDLLIDESADLRALPFEDRRRRLEDFAVSRAGPRIDLSDIVAFDGWEHAESLRAAPPDDAAEGLMLKRWDSLYVPGRPKGPWFKWKRDPFLVDAVLLYAQRGHGKRSSFYSDFTFGVWRNADRGEELVPVGKAYFGFSDEELKQLDKFVRDNTVKRFGPVREVTHEPDEGLVIEVAFEGLNRSTRHKSGVAMRFPRFHRIRWDKPPHEADRIEVLQALLPPEA